MASRVEEGSSQSELDIAFRFLVDNIGLNWRTLAPELGLTPGQIGWVTRQCGGNVMKEVFQCLCTWKETFSEKATVQELVRALHKTKVRLLSRMADEIVKKCPSARNQMLSTLPKPGRKRKDVNLLSVSLPTKRQRWGTVQSSKGTTNGSKVTSPQNVKVHPKQTASQVIVRKNGGEGSKTLQVKGNTLKSSGQSSLTVRVVRSEGKGHDLKSKGQSSVSTGNSRQSNSSASSATSSRTESKPQSSSSLPKKVMIQKGSDVRTVAEIRPKQTTSNKDLRPRRECTVVKKEDTQKAEASKKSEDDTSAKKDKVDDDSDHDDVVAEIMILDEKTGRLVLGKKKPGQQGVSTSQGSAAVEQDSVQENTDFYMREVVNEIKKTYRKLFCVPEVFLFGSLVRLNVAHVYTQLQMVDRDTQTPVEDIGSIITPQAQTVRAGTVMLVTPRRILIEGEQGIGKSTFCHKISYNWGCTLFNVYVQFSLVFKIDLSSVRADIVSTVCHQLLEVDTKMKRSDMRAFIEKRQHETLFILDGLDQLPAHAHPEYLALMKKEILPKACVIVTTRPLEQLPCEFDSYYIMKGFTPEKRKEYVRRHLGRLSLKVIEELHSVWQLDEIIRNPLNAVLLCRLYEINQGLPDTFTAMFTKLVMGVVGWNCHRKGIEMKGEEIPSAVHQIIASLGHIAWEGLRNGLMSFDVSELRRCYPITNEILKFGFLMFVMPEEPCGQSLRCTFSHRVFQEIFSACYISTMARLTPDSELTAAYLRLCTQEGFQQVCVFVSGLLKDKSEILFQQLAAQIKFCSELNRPVGAPGTMNPLDDTLHLALLCLHETGEVDRFAPLVASHFAKRLFISDWSSKSCLQSIVSILQYQDAQQPDEVQETTAEVSETTTETAVNGTADSTAIEPAEESKEAPESKTGEEQKSDSVEKMDTSETDTKSKTPAVEENKRAQDSNSRSEEGSSPLKSKALVTETSDQVTDTQKNGTAESRSKAGDEEEMEVEISKDQNKSKKELQSEEKNEDCVTCEKEEDKKHGEEKDDGNTKDAMKKKEKQSPQKQTQDSRTLRRGRSRTSSTLPDEKEEKEDSDKETEEEEDKEAHGKTSKKSVDTLKGRKGPKDTESSEEEEEKEQQKTGRNTRSRTKQESSKDRKVSRRGKDNSEGEEDLSPGGRGKIPESPRRSSRRKEALVDPVGSRTRSTGDGKKAEKVNSTADDDNDDKNEGYVDPIGSRTRRRTRSDALQVQVGGSLGSKPATRTSPRAKAARRDRSSGSEQEFVDPVGLRTRTRARGANVQSPSKERKPSASDNTKESPEVDAQDKEEKMSEEEGAQEGEGEFIDPIGLRVRGRRAKSIAREQLRVIADDKFELRRQEATRVSPRSRAREMSSPPKSPGRGRPRKSSEGEGKEEKSTRSGRRQSPKGEDRQKGPKIKWGKGVQGKGKSPPKPKKEEEEKEEEDKTEEAEDVREKDAEETSKKDVNDDVKTQKDGEQQEKEETGPEEEEEEEVLEEEPEDNQAGLNSLEISIFASNLQIVFRALRNNRIIRTLTFTDRFLPATRNICHLDWFDSLGELFLHNTSLRTLIIDSANYRVTRGAFTNVVTAAVTSKSLQTIQLKFELHQKAEKTSGYIRLGIPLEKLTESPSLQTVSVELTSKMTSHEEAANDVTRTVVKLLKKPSNLKKVSFTVKAKDSYFLQVLPVLRAMQVNSTISDFSIDMGAQPSTRYTLAAIKEVLTFNSGLTSLRVKFHTPAPVNSDDLTEVFTAVENSDLRAFTLDMGCGWSTDPLDPPVLALADLLANNNTLRKLHVRLDCPWSPQAISNDTIALLCAAMYANSTVKELNISGIYTAEDNGPRIIQALLKHKGTKFTIDMPYWWNAYCQVAADYCEGIVMEHYFDKEDTEGSGKKKKKKKEAATPKKEEKTAADSKEAKPGTSSTETKTAAESEEILTVTDSSESSETDEGNTSTKTTSQNTDTSEKAVDSTEKSTCKPSSSEETDKSKQCPELSKMLTTDSKKLATDKSDLCPELSKMLTTETESTNKTEEKEDKEARKDTNTKTEEKEEKEAKQDTNTKEGSTESRDVENTEKREGGSETASVEEETPSCSGHSKGKGKAKSTSDPKPPVASHPVPVSTRRTTAAALIQAGDDLPEFLNQFPEYKNARMIRSGRIMVNVEVDCLGSTGYGSGFLSDTFKLTEAGRKKLELIKTREAKNTVAVRETLFCSGKTNCQRECGGIGDCVRGCNKDSNRGHRCSFRVKLHMYMDRLNFWEVTVEGEHLPSATGQQWIPYNKHSHMYVRNGVWSTLDQ